SSASKWGGPPGSRGTPSSRLGRRWMPAQGGPAADQGSAPPSKAGRIYPKTGCQFCQLAPNSGWYWDALSTAFLLRAPFGLAGDQHFVVTHGGAGAGYGLADEFHALGEFVERHEAGDIDGQEVLADFHRPGAVPQTAHLGEHRAAGEHRAKNLDHH